MFELYATAINPDDPEFQAYIERYVSTKDPRPPDTIPYSELYKVIKEAIREYIHKTTQTQRGPNK
jgi:hypothetical protein